MQNLAVVEDFIQGARSACGDVSPCFGQQGIKSSGLEIFFDLAIPFAPEFVLKTMQQIPLLPGWELVDRLFDFLHAAHFVKIAALSFKCKQARCEWEKT